MTSNPNKDDLKVTLHAISRQGVEYVLKKLPTRYAEGVDPKVTAQAKRKPRRETT